MNEKELRNYQNVVEKQTGRAVRPFGEEDKNGYREDGFKNVLTSYGTQRDSSEHYEFETDMAVPDTTLAEFYEQNGLFSKIIDAPAEEAVKHGFELDGVEDEEIKNFCEEGLDELDWEETFMQSIKWARLFGGSIAVMLVNDGQGLEKPLDWNKIESIDDIRIYDRSVIVPDYASMFKYDSTDPFRTRGSRLGYPETFHVTSKYGTFDVHETRCLIFQNGVLPENTPSALYQMWGMPEYMRIYRAVKDAEIAHGMAPKMLDRSVQGIYKMMNLASELATEGGEDRVLKRLQTIDLARGLLNTMVLDAEGEEYDFRSFSYGGVAEVINTTCNYLSAVTNIPQTILFGRSPAGMNATGSSDLENYYNYVERIQKRMVKSNLRYLIAVLMKAGKHTGEIKHIPPIKVKFNPLWSLNENEQVALDMQKAQLEATKAQTANVYVQMQAIDPTEIRKKLADEGEFDVETMLDEFTDEELEENNPANKQQGGDPMAAMMGMMGGGQGGMPQEGMPQGGEEGANMGVGEGEGAEEGKDMGQPVEEPVKGVEKSEGNSPESAPEATKLPQDKLKEELNKDEEDSDVGVGVLVVKDGKILTGTRLRGEEVGTICGAGGHILVNEKPLDAAIRETKEEFGIVPIDLVLMAKFKKHGDTKGSYQYLCTEFEGEPECDDVEMRGVVWRDIDELYAMKDKLFTPFAKAVDVAKEKAKTGYFRYGESWE